MKSGNVNFLEFSGPIQTSNGTAINVLYIGFYSHNFTVSSPYTLGLVVVVVTEHRLAQLSSSSSVVLFMYCVQGIACGSELVCYLMEI